MAKKVEGALYKKVSGSDYFDEGTIIRLVHDDGSNVPKFSDGMSSWFLAMSRDVKLLKPKVGDFVRLYRTKHSKRDECGLGYYPEEGMLKKGEHGIVKEIDKVDGSAYVEHNGSRDWYYLKDLAVIEREGVSI